MDEPASIQIVQNLTAEIRDAATRMGAIERALSDKVSQSLLTTRGDLIRRGASAPERVALGATGAQLTSNGTDAVWTAPIPWTTLSLASGWSQFGAPNWQTPQYMRSPDGLVTVKGVLARTNVGAASPFTLPAGCRPALITMHPIICAAPTEASIRCDVTSAGLVTPNIGAVAIAYASFAFSFMAEA